MRTLVCLAICVALSATADAQTPAFTTRTDAVEVDVLVTEDGRVVRGLQANDFDLRDNGQRRRIDVVTLEQRPLSVMLALDVSDSLDDGQRAQLRAAGGLLLDHLLPVDTAGIVTFDQRVTLAAPVTLDRQLARDGLAMASGQGRTALIDAVFAAIVAGEAGTGRALLIVFSDGIDSSSRLAPRAALDTAGRSNVVVYGVSVGPVPPRGVLSELAERTGGRVLDVASHRDIGAAFLRILEEFRQRYVLTFIPDEPGKAEWRTLEVRVRNRRAVVSARTGYYSEP